MRTTDPEIIKIVQKEIDHAYGIRAKTIRAESVEFRDDVPFTATVHTTRGTCIDIGGALAHELKLIYLRKQNDNN